MDREGNTIFISCGQRTEEERELGSKIQELVNEVPGFKAYFAEEQSSAQGLTAHIFNALNNSVGLIAIMHRRGEVNIPDQVSFHRASVWIEQELAIAAFIEAVMQRNLKVAIFIEYGIKREGVREHTIYNPIVFHSNDEILHSLRSKLEEWGSQKERSFFDLAQLEVGPTGFLGDNQEIGIIEPRFTKPRRCYWQGGPHLFLRLVPYPAKEFLTPKKAKELVLNDLRLKPLGAMGGEPIRRQDGCCLCYWAGNDEDFQTDSATQLFNDYSLWGICSSYFFDGVIHITWVQDTLVEASNQYLQFYDKIGVHPPLAIVLGIGAVRGFQITIGPTRPTGNCIEDSVVLAAMLEDPVEDVKSIVQRLVDKIWDTC